MVIIAIKETKHIILNTISLNRELTTNNFCEIIRACWEFILMSFAT